MLTREDLKHCLQHYPQVAEHIESVAKERYRLLKMHEISTVIQGQDHPFQCDDQNDDQEGSKRSWFNQRLIINPESYIGLLLSAIGHILALFTSLILPYQVK